MAAFRPVDHPRDVAAVRVDQDVLAAEIVVGETDFVALWRWRSREESVDPVEAVLRETAR